MSWTEPRTWVTDEVVTAPILNTHVRDNLLALHHPFHVENTDIDATNSSNEISLFTAAPVIPANAMGSNGWVRATLWGDYAINATARSIIFRLKFGGTTLLESNAAAPTNADSDRMPWKIEIDLLNRGATNAQLVTFLTIAATNTTASATTGTGGASFLSTAGNMGFWAQNTGTIDTATNQTLDVSVQFDTAATTYSWRKRASRVWIAQA